MRGCRRPGLLALLAAVLTVGPSRAFADWSVTRSPFDPALVGRYRGALERDPDDAVVLDKLWSLYARYRSPRDLTDEYTREARANPSSYAAVEVLGQLQLRGGDVHGAIASFQSASTLRPGSAPSWVHLASAQQQAGDDAAALDAYGHALEATPEGPARWHLLRDRFQLELASARLDQASTDADSLARAGTLTLDDLAALGAALARAGRPAAALERFKAAERRAGTDPQRHAQILVEIGNLEETTGDDDAALQSYDRAFDLIDPSSWLRGDITDRVIGVYRRRDDLRSLEGLYERRWPPSRRGYFEWHVLARLYDETGDIADARRAYAAALDASPTEVECRLHYIALLDRIGDDAAVLDQYRQLVRMAPDEPRYRLELADRYHRAGDTAKALAILAETAERFASDESVHSALADLYGRWGEDRLALVEAERLVAIDPHDESYLVALGDLYLQRGDVPRALATWQRLLDAIPQKDRAYGRLGDVLSEHDRNEEAIAAYQRAADLAPREPSYRRGLALVLERVHRDDDAERAWQAVIAACASDPARKPMRREARSRLIDLWVRRGAGVVAARLHDYQVRFGGSPPDLDAGYFVAEILLKENQTDAAEQVLDRVAALAPKDPEPLLTLVDVYKADGRIDDALRTLRALALLLPSQAKTFESEIADLDERIYKDDDGVAGAEKAAALAPSDAEAQVKLARIYERREDYGGAEQAYRKALALNGHLYPAEMALALLQLREGHPAAAQQLYLGVVHQAVGDETITDAAHKAIDIAEHEGTLASVEQDLRELPYLHSDKPVYRRILVELYARYLPALVAARQAAVPGADAALASIGQHGLAPLLDALHDDSAEQRSIALACLGELGNPRATDALLHLALDGLTSSERSAGTGDASAPPATESTVSSEETGDAVGMDARVEAVIDAGRLSDPKVVEPLSLLLSSGEAALGAAAAWALGRTGSPAAVRPLVAALSAGPPTEMQGFACLALGDLAARGAATSIRSLVQRADLPPAVRAACVLALGRVGGDQDVASLAALTHDRDVTVTSSAAIAVARLGGPHGVGLLLPLAVGRPPATERVAMASIALAAGARGPTESSPSGEVVRLRDGMPDLAAAVQSRIDAQTSASDVGKALTPSLFRAHLADLVTAFAAGLADPSRSERTLCELETVAAPHRLLCDSPLARALTEADDGVDSLVPAVVQSLVPALARLAAEGSPSARTAAVAVAARSGEGRAVVERALDDGSAAVRLAAIEAVPELPPSSARSLLVRLVAAAAPSRPVVERAHALETAVEVARKTDADVSQLLLDALRDDDPLVACTALRVGRTVASDRTSSSLSAALDRARTRLATSCPRSP